MRSQPAGAAALFPMLLAVAACGAEPPEFEDPPGVETVLLPALPSGRVDVIVVLERSAAMVPYQAALGAGFDALLDPLAAAGGSTFGLHLGVTTTDDALGVMGDYLVDELDNFDDNFTGSRHDALAAMFQVGAGTGALPAPLAVVDRAVFNYGHGAFHGLNDNLLVVVVTGADDASGTDPATVARTLAAASRDPSRFAAGVIAAGEVPQLHAFTDAVGAHGAVWTGGAADITAGLAQVERRAAQMFGVACLDSTLLRDISTEPGVQPDCEAVEVGDGVETPLPRCPAEGVADRDCFQMFSDDYACPHVTDYLRFGVNYVHAPTAHTYARAVCQVP